MAVLSGQTQEQPPLVRANTATTPIEITANIVAKSHI